MVSRPPQQLFLNPHHRHRHRHGRVISANGNHQHLAPSTSSKMSASTTLRRAIPPSSHIYIHWTSSSSSLLQQCHDHRPKRQQHNFQYNHNSSFSSRSLSTATTNSFSYENIALTSAEYLQTFHQTVSIDLLPWSVTIPLVALSVRVVTLPLLYHTQIHQGRAAIAATELPKIHHFVRNSPGTILQKYRTFRRLRALTLKAAGTSPLLQFPWHLTVTVPFVITASMGLRNLATIQLPGWEQSSFLHIPDLLSPDPYGILPVFTTMLWLWNLDPRLDARRRAIAAAQKHTTKRSKLVDTVMTRFGETFTTALQMIAVASLIATTELPSGLILFWASNAVLNTAQRVIISRDSVRTYLGLPTSKDIQNVQQSNLMPAVEQGVENVRKELSYVQTRVSQLFHNRAVDDQLRDDINRMLKRERWGGRISVDLEAVIREDDRDGKLYVAVVPRGSTDSS